MPEIQEFKGNKVLCLNPESKFPFSFGIAKAKLVLEHLETIKKFVESEGKDIGDAGKPAGNEQQDAF